MLIEEESQLVGGGESTPDIGAVLVPLLKGVLYQDTDPRRWTQLMELQNRVRDYVAVLGLELILDEAEGYAFLQTRQQGGDDGERQEGAEELPRLVARRQLSFPVSLLLALLRKKLAEFDASGSETRLVLTREEIVDLICLFLPDSSNEARLVDQVDEPFVLLGQIAAQDFTRDIAGFALPIIGRVAQYVDDLQVHVFLECLQLITEGQAVVVVATIEEQNRADIFAFRHSLAHGIERRNPDAAANQNVAHPLVPVDGEDAVRTFKP